MSKWRYGISLLLTTAVYATLGIIVWSLTLLETPGEESTETVIEIALLKPPPPEVISPPEIIPDEPEPEPTPEPEPEPEPEPTPEPEPEPTPEPEPIVEPEPTPEPKIEPKPKQVKKIKKKPKRSKPKKIRKKVTKKSSKPQPSASGRKEKNSLKAFKRRVKSTVVANKRYPRAAIKRNMQGRVKVTFDIKKNGRVSNIRASGGTKILRKAAKSSVKKSFPMKIPSSIISRFPMRNISINLVFKLR